MIEEAASGGPGRVSLRVPGASDSVGLVMAEGGRLCWAMAAEVSTRLGDRIAAETAVSRSDLERLFQECRREGTPFGEFVLSRQLLRPERLRALLLDQVGITLGALLGQMDGNGFEWGPWEPAPTPTYNPSFTFMASEVVGSVLCHYPETYVGLPERPQAFDQLLENSVAGVYLLEVDSRERIALPILVQGGLTLCQEGCNDLLRQSRSFLKTPALVAAGASPYLTFARQERFYLIIAGWEAYVLAAEVEDPSVLVRFASEMRRWKRGAS